MHIKIQEISAEQTYDLRHIVMYPDLPFDYIKLPKDHEGVHFGVIKNNIIVTVVSLFIEGNLENLLPQNRNKGMGMLPHY